MGTKKIKNSGTFSFCRNSIYSVLDVNMQYTCFPYLIFAKLANYFEMSKLKRNNCRFTRTCRAQTNLFFCIKEHKEMELAPPPSRG